MAAGFIADRAHKNTLWSVKRKKQKKAAMKLSKRPYNQIIVQRI